MLYFAKGSATEVISPGEVRCILHDVFDRMGYKNRILAIPPDITRLNSFAGPITEMCYEYFGSRLTDIMPAIGTHSPMTESQISFMFGEIPLELFRIHDWRNDVVTVGEVPSSYIEKVSEGKLHYSWKAQVNKLLMDPGFDLILSIGQVVPHEVIGMANYNKNIFVGVGGSDGINKSHFLGATYGMERIMGRAKSPVRDILDYSSQHFIKELPIVYIQTVLSKGDDGQMKLRGLFIGDDSECFYRAAELALQANFIMVEKPIQKCLVWLDPQEFKSTWLGNKAIYRTRMALADDAELIIMAPALKEFGEDKAMDGLIRKYGYKGTPATLRAVDENDDLKANLGAAAHLIHGSSEGRFNITYCPGNDMARKDIEDVGFHWGSLEDVIKKYSPSTLNDGWNIVDGEEIYYISNPALGLWAHPDRFND